MKSYPTIGSHFCLSEDGLENYGEEYKGKVFEITHVTDHYVPSKEFFDPKSPRYMEPGGGPGFDSCVGDLLVSSTIGFDLYLYEIEYVPSVFTAGLPFPVKQVGPYKYQTTLDALSEYIKTWSGGLITYADARYAHDWLIRIGVPVVEGSAMNNTYVPENAKTYSYIVEWRQQQPYTPVAYEDAWKVEE